MEPNTPWLPAAVPSPGPTPDSAPLAHTPTSEPPPRNQSWIRRRLSALGAAIVALLAKLKAILLLLPKLKLLASTRDDARLARRLRTALGMAVRRRLHRAAVRPRDGPRDRAPARGDQGERADLHPIPGRGDRRALARRQRAGRGAGRLAGPILGSIGSAACILVWHATGNSTLWRRSRSPASS